MLLDLIEQDKPVLLGARGSIPRSKKVAAWDNVAQAVNAAFPSTHRTGKDCEKRYRSVKAQERPAISALKKQYTATGKEYVEYSCYFYSTPHGSWCPQKS